MSAHASAARVDGKAVREERERVERAVGDGREGGVEALTGPAGDEVDGELFVARRLEREAVVGAVEPGGDEVPEAPRHGLQIAHHGQAPDRVDADVRRRPETDLRTTSTQPSIARVDRVSAGPARGTAPAGRRGARRGRPRRRGG